LTCFLSFLSFAACSSLAFLSCLDSCGYLASNLNKFLAFFRLYLPWLESQALVNWLSAGGTLSLFIRILFCLWRRMYLGHLTNLVRSLVGWMDLPTPNFLGVTSKRPLLWTCFFFPAPAPAAPVFFFGATFFGCYKVNLPFGFLLTNL
jgi:hypothetical protein